MTADQFTVSETRLAGELGVPRKTIKGVRSDALEERADWIYSADNGAVLYSKQGVARALAALGLPLEKIAALVPAETAPAPAEPPPSPPPVDLPPNDPPPPSPDPALDLSAQAVAEVKVTRCFALNKRIIAGVIGEEPVRVKVKSSLKLRPGMVLRCTLIEGDLYELAERLPRWVGKH